MTIAVLWYRQKFDELWCATDSRISRGKVTTTDSGPKILPVPVLCHKASGENYERSHTHSFGFAFAGSTLSAISTHALVTACTQNLATAEKISGPPRLEVIAELFRAVGEDFISDISTRATGATNLTAYFFEAYIFGFCPVKQAYQGFCIAPDIRGPTFKMLKAEMVIRPNVFYPMGSGADTFVELSRELDKTHRNPGVVITLREMLKRERVASVGGHFQIGVAHKCGFDLRPILNLGEGALNRTVTFLGWNVDSIGQLDGYRIGYQAFSPDID